MTPKNLGKCHSGIAKVIWRKLNREIPQSVIISGGVDAFTE